MTTTNQVRESACQFGPTHRLAGIITAPVDGTPRAAFILVNAGLVPKFGPYRLYAEMARRLAADGIVTLRFDLSGLGDSLEENAHIPLLERTRLEVKAALDFLAERYRLGDVIVGGLCSGAEDSFRFAEHDNRVTGVVLIEPFAYKTFGWWWRHQLFRVARRSLRALGLYVPYPSTADRTELIDYAYMPHSESSRILTALIRRKVRMHFIYHGLSEHYNHPGQLKAMFPKNDFQGQITVDYLPQLGHTQMLKAERRILIETVTKRLVPA